MRQIAQAIDIALAGLQALPMNAIQPLPSAYRPELPFAPKNLPVTRLCHGIGVTHGAFKTGDAVTGAATKFRHCT
jgi:hypothetical protein